MPSTTYVETAAAPGADARTVMLNEISWRAVLAGVACALVAQLLMNLLGLGIGIGTLDPGTADNPSAAAFSVAAAIWWAVSGIVASLLGGYTAGRLSGRPSASTGAWHGLIAWAATTLVVFYLLTSAIGSVVSGAATAVGATAGGLTSALGSAASTAVKAAAPGADPFGAIETQIRSATGGTDPAALRDAAASAVKAALTGDAAQANEARERAAQALAKAQNVPIEDARSQVAAYAQQYQQTVDQAKAAAVRAAEAAAKAVSTGAIAGFIALLLGALAGWLGGRLGTVNRVPAAVVTTRS